MRLRKLLLLWLLFLFIHSTFAQDYDLNSILDHLKTLSSDAYQGRGNGQEGGQMAKTYLIREFEKLGLKPFGDDYIQEFQFYSRISKEQGKGENLIGIIPGKAKSDQYIVISAHYDHLGIRKDNIYNGADDNGSGTCALLAIASHFMKNPTDYSIIIAAFDAEELGLRGAKHFVEEPPVDLAKIKLNINMDMVGRNVNNEIYICGTYHTPKLKKFNKKIAKKAAIKVSFGHDKPNDQKQDDWTQASDHGPFHKVGIPFLYFGEEDHPDYHQPTDDFSGIMPEFYEQVINLVIKITQRMDQKLDKI